MPKGRPSCSRCQGAEYRAEAGPCPRCADVRAQAEDWLLEKCPPSVSGSNGHGAAIHAACKAVGGFALDEGAALEVMRAWNGRCAPPWSERELIHKVREAARLTAGEERGGRIWHPWGAGSGPGRVMARREDEARRAEAAANPAAAAPQKAREFDLHKLRAEGCGAAVDAEWLAARSVCRPESVTPELFLSGMFRPGERVLVFTEFASQGQYLWVCPGGAGEAARHAGAWRLGRRKGEKARRVEQLPREGPCGVWFLNQPVSGLWLPKEYTARGASPEYSRRHAAVVTRWAHMVLESDIKGIESEWLSLLAGLKLPVKALYTSGGKSVHALLRVEVSNKSWWDHVRNHLKPWLTELGADPGVFSAVRLTRLPGTWRLGTEGRDKTYTRYDRPRRQELLYFNPGAAGEERIADRAPARCGMAAGAAERVLT